MTIEEIALLQFDATKGLSLIWTLQGADEALPCMHKTFVPFSLFRRHAQRRSCLAAGDDCHRRTYEIGQAECQRLSMDRHTPKAHTIYIRYRPIKSTYIQAYNILLIRSDDYRQ